jgi:hypothetical protein
MTEGDGSGGEASCGCPSGSSMVGPASGSDGGSSGGSAASIGAGVGVGAGAMLSWRSWGVLAQRVCHRP